MIEKNHRPNSWDLVPFMSQGKIIHYIEMSEFGEVPKEYVYNKKLWRLRTGYGSTYYVQSKKQVLPFVEDGPWHEEME